MACQVIMVVISQGHALEMLKSVPAAMMDQLANEVMSTS